jgi:hypothetical protein
MTLLNLQNTHHQFKYLRLIGSTQSMGSLISMCTSVDTPQSSNFWTRLMGGLSSYIQINTTLMYVVVPEGRIQINLWSDKGFTMQLPFYKSARHIILCLCFLTASQGIWSLKSSNDGDVLLNPTSTTLIQVFWDAQYTLPEEYYENI